MGGKQSSSISLPVELGEEIDVEVKYSFQNDGIGAYEYWGAKCFDAGQDYIEIEDIMPIWTDQSEELKIQINKYIDDNYEELSNNVEQRLEFEQDERD